MVVHCKGISIDGPRESLLGMLNGFSRHEELQRLRGLLLPGHQSVGLAAFRALASAAAHLGSSKAPKRAFGGPPGPLSGSPTRRICPPRDAGPTAAKGAAQEARRLLPEVYVHLKSAACKDTTCIVFRRLQNSGRGSCRAQQRRFARAGNSSRRPNGSVLRKSSFAKCKKEKQGEKAGKLASTGVSADRRCAAVAPARRVLLRRLARKSPQTRIVFPFSHFKFNFIFFFPAQTTRPAPPPRAQPCSLRRSAPDRVLKQLLLRRRKLARNRPKKCI